MAKDTNTIQVLGFEDDKQEINEKQLATHLGRTLQTRNLVVLTGAGSSIQKDEAGTSIGGLTMAELTTGLKNDTDFKAATTKGTLNEDILKPITETTDIEQLLSSLDSLIAADKVAGAVNADKLITIQTSALAYMHKKCIIKKTNDAFPHGAFLKKLLISRKLGNPRIKVFTLNYDTLFEQAAQELEAIVIDGFSFAQPRKFQGNNFDLDIVKRNHSRLHKEESYYLNVLHLYKLHGSVDWRINGERIEQVEPSAIEDAGGSVMVYPGSHKYQASYSMPFYEMISRFQAAIREPNTSLLVIGYSFNDEHINRIVQEAAASNLGLCVYIVSPSAANTASASASETLKAIQGQIVRQETRNIFCISQNFQDFTKLLPHYGTDDSPVGLEQTNRQIDQALQPTSQDQHEEDIPF